MKKKTPCYRKEGDCVEGDSIYVQCQSPGNWRLFRKSEQHRGWTSKAKKGAKAILLKSFTNVKQAR